MILRCQSHKSKNRISILTAVISLLFFYPACGVGESAVITLIFPYGARSGGMGETGVALADDESVVFWNPAGLGLINERWQTGAVQKFYEPLLPAFGIRELWHATFSGVLQIPNTNIGGFGFNVNFINMGNNTWTDDLGREIGHARSFEYVATLAWGLELDDLHLENHFLGFALKYIHSALAPGYGPNGKGVASGYAVDLGYLHTFGPGFRLGTTMKNMGPNVYYISYEQADPIPFTMDIAVGFKKETIVENVRLFQVATEIKASKELVRNHIDKKPDPFWKAMFTEWGDAPLEEEIKEIQLNTGVELTIMNTGSIRTGLLWDQIGRRFETDIGLGFKLFNHYAFDWSYIHAPEGYLRNLSRKIDRESIGANGARHGQWRITFTALSLAMWSARDEQWWLTAE